MVKTPQSDAPATMLTDDQFIAKRVLERLHTANLDQNDLAEYLSISESGMCKALQRKDGMRKHAYSAAEFLKVPVTDLTGLPEEVSRRELPIQRKRRSHMEADAPLSYLGKNQTVSDFRPWKPGGGFMRLRTGDNPEYAEWVVVGSKIDKPRTGALVLVQAIDGKLYIKKFSEDSKREGWLVLLPETPYEEVVLLRTDEVKEMRLIIGKMQMFHEEE